ncbi:MAG: hypothetical protein H0U95_07760 [Bacteroidetes bacterium]|nr:hypothetical protein [Bacteroidota bacterium]
MKYFVAIIIFVLFCADGSAQDSIFFRSEQIVVARVKEINPETIKYSSFSEPIRTYEVSRDSVLKIKYADGTIEQYEITVKPESQQQKHLKKPVNYDSLPLVRNSVRIYFTDIVYNKVSFGYERMYTKRYSLDVDGFYKFLPEQGNNYYGTDWKTLLYNRSEGGEIKIGASRHYYKGRRRMSLGAAASYRQQVMAHVELDSKQDKYRPDDGIYYFTQTKKGVGLFLKLNFQFKRDKSSLEFFIIPGTYAAFTKNTYFSWKTRNALPASATITDPNNIPKLQTRYMKDGFAFLPYLNFGFAVVIKQKPKGSHKN